MCSQHVGELIGKSLNKSKRWLHGNKTNLAKNWFEWTTFLPDRLFHIVWVRLYPRLSGVGVSPKETGKVESHMVQWLQEIQIFLNADGLCTARWKTSFQDCRAGRAGYLSISLE